MMRPRTAQEFVHWLEAGRGAHWIRLAAAFALTLALSGLVAWKQFHGPVTESTLIQADTGRQLAAGAGFSTLVNFPQTVAFLQMRGTKFDPSVPYPELHQAPLYSVVIAGALRVIPGSLRGRLFASAPVPPDGFAGDYLLLVLNVGLLWLAAWLTFDLGRRLFDAMAGWVAACGLLVSVPIWQQTVAVNGTPLLMVLALTGFWIWLRIETVERGTPIFWLGALGANCALLCLAEYSSGTMLLVALAYAAWRYAGRARGLAVAALLGGFLVVAGPWIWRNISLTGNPVGLAWQNLALKAGDSTAEPSTIRATLSAAPPVISLTKLGNKTLTSLQENLRSRFWSGGAMWFAAFFVAGTLYTFRSTAVNRLRWLFAVSLLVLLVAQAALNSGESDRPVTVWLAPLMIIFGAGFFFVLLGSNSVLSRWPRVVAGGLLIAQALPLIHDALEPRRLHFQYPPYLPGLFQGMKRELAQRGVVDQYGLMADVPAGVAWYSGGRVWAQPPRLRDFYEITLIQPVGELLLSPRTLDRPFFSDLNAKPFMPDSLRSMSNRFGEWGEIYAGLLTGRLPGEFPLQQPTKLMENLYVLVNQTMPPARGK